MSINTAGLLITAVTLLTRLVIIVLVIQVVLTFFLPPYNPVRQCLRPAGLPAAGADPAGDAKYRTSGFQPTGADYCHRNSRLAAGPDHYMDLLTLRESQ